MSIGLLAATNPSVLSIWLIWAGFAVVLAGFTLAGYARYLFEPKLEPTDVVIRLGPAAVLAYAAFLSTADLLARQSLMAGYAAHDVGQVAIRTVTAPLIGAIVGFVLLRAGQYRTLVGIRGTRLANAILWGLLGITIALPLVWWTMQASSALFDYFHIQHPKKHGLLLLLDQPVSIWPKIAIVLGAAVITPVFEELLFRGMVQTVFRRISGRAWVGILIASMLFAVVHEPWTWPAIFVLSVCIGSVYHLSGSLWAAITMHSVFNAFSLATSGAQ